MEKMAFLQELLRDIRVLTSRQFIFEDPWGGFVPVSAGEKLEPYLLGAPGAFADLGFRDKADVLRSFISWDHYSKLGLDWRDEDAIVINVAEGKPPDRWLEGTRFLEPLQERGRVSAQATPPGERFQEILDYQPAERAGLLAHTAESVKTQLESFKDEFERLARTPEQKRLTEAFKDFVGEVTSASMKDTFDKLLRRFAKGEIQTPEQCKDRAIER